MKKVHNLQVYMKRQHRSENNMSCYVVSICPKNLKMKEYAINLWKVFSVVKIDIQLCKDFLYKIKLYQMT